MLHPKMHLQNVPTYVIYYQQLQQGMHHIFSILTRRCFLEKTKRPENELDVLYLRNERLVSRAAN